MQLDQLSILHVKVFLSVYRHRKAKLAASELGLSTVAVSRLLGQLREILDDELFVRQSRGFLPTQRADEIVPTFLEVERLYQTLGERYTKFSPSEAVGKFVILAYDEFEGAVQEAIQKNIQPYAPKLKIVVHIMTRECERELRDGTVDFAVVYEGFGGNDLVHEAFSYPTEICMMCREDHPLASKKNFTTSDLAKYPLVEIDNPKDVERPLLVEICRQDGRNMHVMSTTESVSSAVGMLLDSNAVTVVCNRFTRRFAGQVKGLACVRLPAPIEERLMALCSRERPIGNYVVYSNVARSAAFLWVKERLVEGLSKAWEDAGRALSEQG